MIAAIREAYSEPLALLGIDTVSRVLAGGNENAPDDMGGFVRSLDHLRDALHCHVAAVHHAGKDTSKGSRGHSLLHCAVDTEIEVTRDASGIATATVTKQRDLPTDGQIAFRLLPVELGRNADDEPVMSCVIEHVADAPKPQQAKRRLPAGQRRALDLLREAIAKDGQIPPACDHIQANTPCVAEDVWRRYCYAGQVGDNPDSKKHAFRHNADALLDANRIGLWGGNVWVIG